jgi:hypothetical protein
MNLFADYNPVETVAGGGIARLMVLVPLLLFIYGLVAFFVPIFVYRIMRRGTQTHETLKRIEKLLIRQQQSQVIGVEEPVEHWVKDLTDEERES